MLISNVEMSIITKLSCFVFILCIFISSKNQNTENRKGSTSKVTVDWSSSTDSSSVFPDISSTGAVYMSMEDENLQVVQPRRSLEYDYYRESCPGAERMVRAIVRDLYRVKSNLAPVLLRLVFHDCFIEGCDASVLLDPADGIDSEKDSPPNKSLKGFDIIDIIKSELEEVCPGIVSCSDILVLAAREGVVLAGGPFYPLCTGRRDSTLAFLDTATNEIPSPNGDLSETLASFASKGFDERETVSLLGAHSIGVIHCKFFQDRLYNFTGTGEPDPSLDPELLQELRLKCRHSHTSTSPAPSPSSSGSPSSSAPESPSFPAPSPSSIGSPSSSAPESPSFTVSPSSIEAPSPFSIGSPTSSVAESPSFTASPWSSTEAPSSAGPPFPSVSSSPQASPSPSNNSMSFSVKESGMNIAYLEPGAAFGAPYYRSILQGKGLLYADQQLLAGEETRTWVRAYASDPTLFHKDFALAMMKLSNLGVLTAPTGQIRLNCAKVA